MTRTGKVFWAKTAVILGVIPVILWAHEYGPDVGYCGVPKENGNCTASGCHVGTANTGSGSVTITFPNGTTYTPGVAQQLKVTVADPATSQKAWGFQLTARQTSSTSTQAGAFASLDANTQVMCSDSTLDPNREKTLSFGVSQTCPVSQPLIYLDQSLNGYDTSRGATGSYSFQFTWTPPATNVGSITFYVGGNAANGDLTVNGDHIYTKTYTLTPAASGNGPTISSVVHNATLQPQIGPNAYVNILGANLSTATDQWTSFITNNNLPTQVDGVSVTIGGKPAYVQYVSPTQVQVLTPPDLGFGSVAVQLTNSAGTSTVATVTSQQYAPGFFLWNNNQPVATHADYSDAMKNGTYTGLTTVPAKPGEYIVLWGTGFGPTNPATPQGTLVPGGLTVYYTAAVPTLTLNGQPMAYYATALTSTFAGLYQVVAQVPPSMPAGDWPLVATIGGVSSPNGILLTVKP